MPSNNAAAIRFEGVTRRFGSVVAVDDVSLSVGAGEFFSMLGPSGSGKTTCLRLIAGFEQPDAGHIEIFGETAEGVPPYRRAVNTVFQDYALFPHMSVLDNVAYGLMVRGIATAAATEGGARHARRRQARPAWSTASPANCPAASASASRSPARSSSSRRCSSSTSRSARST